MTPKMADQFSTLRRELKNVQRSMADLQRRLPALAQSDHVLEPLTRVEEDRRRSLRMPTPTRDDRRDPDESAVAHFRLAAEDRRFSAVDGGGGRVPLLKVVHGPPRDSIQRQDATNTDNDDNDDDDQPVAISDVRNDRSKTSAEIDQNSPTDVFTLCL